MDQPDLDAWHMRRALELAARGLGAVEPNPLVGCVVARGAEIIGEGWHRRFGGPHAEVEALRMAGYRARGATLYVTLEPCCHQGKTPPCVGAIVAAGVSRVVAAQRDPFPAVDGGGAAQLATAGLAVEVGVCEAEVRRLNAPYLKLLRSGRPWVIAKWAMTLDGKTATATGSSRWISNARSRQVVHALRGRMDAILVGRRTVQIDDPLLTARPPGPRTALRVVVDTAASISPASRLVRTAGEVPVLVAAAPEAPEESRRRLAEAGCEVFLCSGDGRDERLGALLDELGRRRMTNLLVEGGGELLGTLLDRGWIDEVHVFVAPKLVGGRDAPSALAGWGISEMDRALSLEVEETRLLDGDLYVRGHVPPAPSG